MDNVHKVFKKGLFFRLGKWIFSIHSYIVFKTYLKLQVSGQEHLPQRPFIICSNHQSHLDAVILGHVGAFNFNRSALIAAKDYWYDQKTRFFTSRFFFNIIPINRKEGVGEFGLLEVSRLAKWFLANGGKCIVILPEGTRSKDGSIRPFKPGVISLAKACELPIVPVYIDNSGHYWPKGSTFINPGKLKIKIGSPIDAANADAALIRSKILELKDC